MGHPNVWVLYPRRLRSIALIDMRAVAYLAGAQQSTGAVGSFVARPDASGADELPAELSAFLARDLQRCTSPLGDPAHGHKYCST